MKLLPLLLLFCCCTAPKSLHQTSTYTIQSVNGYVVTFKNISGKYQMPVDTLHIGDTVKMNVIKMKR